MNTKIWLKKIFKKFFHSPTEPLIKIHLHKSALLNNIAEFKRYYPKNIIAPVLKSNAYGHGLVEIATILKEYIDMFIIDSYHEAEKLRNHGVKNKLLIIGYVRPECINNYTLKNISYVITSIESLKEIKNTANIHLKIDTGMHRQGISVEEIDTAFEYIIKNKNINLEGICSHLSDA
ncbi:MAG: alanine racemase, partial [Patescibacteria group bacterium]